jgi:hypothetical protein
MLSESARMTTAAEARFRIDAPNSLPRATKVIALDAASETLVKDLARAKWNNASFLTTSAFAGPLEPGREGAPRAPFSMQGWLSDLAGRTKDLIDEVNTADLVVMVAQAGESAHAASLIGDACAAKHVMTTALILGGAAQSDAALAKTLSHLRPYSQMVVIASAEEYVFDMLTALRA